MRGRTVTPQTPPPDTNYTNATGEGIGQNKTHRSSYLRLRDSLATVPRKLASRKVCVEKVHGNRGGITPETTPIPIACRQIQSRPLLSTQGGRLICLDLEPIRPQIPGVRSAFDNNSLILCGQRGIDGRAGMVYLGCR